MYEQRKAKGEKARYRVHPEAGRTKRQELVSFLLHLPTDVKATFRASEISVGAETQEGEPEGFDAVLPESGTPVVGNTVYLQPFRVAYEIDGDRYKKKEESDDHLWLYDGWTVSPGDVERVTKKLQYAQKEKTAFSIDYVLSCEQERRTRRLSGEFLSQGGELYLELRILESGNGVYLREELALERERKEILSSLFEDWVYEYNIAEGRVSTISGSAAQYRMLGAPDKTQAYLRLDDLHPEDRPAFLECCKGTSKGSGASYVEARIKCDGVYRWISLTTRLLSDMEGHPVSVIGKVSDIDEKRKEEMRLKKEAMQDSLTGLLNKEAFREEAEYALLAALQEHSNVALLMIDIDSFKTINDHHGHLYGDTVILSMAEAMQETTGKRDVLGRFGGDEFTVLVCGFADEDALAGTVKRLREEFSKSCLGAKEETRITCSVGISVFGKDGGTLNELFLNADNALYHVKNHGKDGYAFCTEQIKQEFSEEYRRTHPEEPIREAGHVPEEITEFALELLEGTKDVKNAIQLLLAKIGKRFGLSGVTVREEDGSGGFSVVYEWKDGKRADSKDSILLSRQDWKRITRSFRENETVAVPDLGALEKNDPLYRLYEARHVRALLQCPLFTEGRVFGNISYVDCVRTRAWEEEEKHSLVIISKIIGNYLAREQAYQRIEHKVELMKSHDEVTGLLKYDRFKEVAQEILDTSSRRARYAVVSTDILHFKYFNEVYGFRSGDELLNDFAALVVRHNHRAVAACRDYADNFIVMVTVESREALLNNVTNYNHAFGVHAAEKYVDSNVEMRSGVYLIDDPEEGIVQAIDNANIARKQLREHGQSGVQMFEPSMKADRLKEIALGHMIEEAIEDGEFRLYLQPKISLLTGTLAGAEALARWRKPSGLIAPPSEFIPVLEKNGKIVNLDYYMYDVVLQQIAKWQQKHFPVVPISVNFSRHHIKNPTFVQHLVHGLREYGLESRLIEIEVTESAFVENQEALIQVMRSIKGEGFDVSIDDFGKGYSSLSMLTELPADIVKIDKDFLRNSAADSTKGMLNNVIRLIKDNHMKVVCEGIETQEQAEFLTKAGCDIGQGYYFAKPLSVQEFEESYYTGKG